MVDFTNRLINAGMDKNTALGRAGAIRLRPILMTTIALVVGSLPSAIGLGQGAEIRRALSVVVIGGLITSTLLTLVVLPALFPWFEERREERPPAGPDEQEALEPELVTARR
jgi:HAE1 family hydrophobic/amphiphilic exporter-1